MVMVSNRCRKTRPELNSEFLWDGVWTVYLCEGVGKTYNYGKMLSFRKLGFVVAYSFCSSLSSTPNHQE